MTRYLPTLFSVFALIWCSAEVLRLPAREVTWTIPAYIVSQCLFSLLAFLALQRWTEHWKGFVSNYMWLFFTLIVVTSLLALCVLGRLLSAYPWGMAFLLIVGSVLFSASAGANVYYQLMRLYKYGVPVGFLFLTIQASVILCCGLGSILTVMEPLSPALHTVALWLSLFWITSGAFLFAYLLGYARTLGMKWENLNVYVPAMLAILCFSALAYTLGTSQRETSRQAVPQTLEVVR